MLPGCAGIVVVTWPPGEGKENTPHLGITVVARAGVSVVACQLPLDVSEDTESARAGGHERTCVPVVAGLSFASIGELAGAGRHIADPLLARSDPLLRAVLVDLAVAIERIEDDIAAALRSAALLAAALPALGVGPGDVAGDRIRRGRRPSRAAGEAAECDDEQRCWERARHDRQGAHRPCSTQGLDVRPETSGGRQAPRTRGITEAGGD